MRLSKLMRLAGRPPSASAPFSPLDYAGLQLWLDARDITTLYQNDTLTTPVAANGDLVSGWKDKSGNGNHTRIEGGFLGFRGEYNTGVLNGFPGVNTRNFAGNVLCLDTDNDVTLNSFTVFCVVKATGGLFFYEHGPNLNGNPGSYFGPTAEPMARVRHATTTDAGTTSDRYATTSWGTGGTPLVGCQTFTYPIQNCYKNGTEISYATSNNPTEPNAAVTAKLFIGARSSGAFGVEGYIGEMLFYSPALTAPQRTAVTDYLTERWSVSAMMMARAPEVPTVPEPTPEPEPLPVEPAIIVNTEEKPKKPFPKWIVAAAALAAILAIRFLWP